MTQIPTDMTELQAARGLANIYEEMWRDAEKENKVLVEALQEAALQLQYLTDKFGETGTGNAILARIRATIKEAVGDAEA